MIRYLAPLVLAVIFYLIWLYIIRPMIRKANKVCEMDAIEDLREMADYADGLKRDPNMPLTEQVERDAWKVRKATEAARKADDNL
jgi:hypothetical protein